MLIEQERSMEVEEFKMDVAITAADLEALLKSSEGKEHSKLYKRRKKKKNKTTQGEISRLEELQDELELWKNPKVGAEKKSKKLTKLFKEAKSECSCASTSLNTATKKKEYGAMTQVRRQNIEELMELLFGIIRSAYHGGDMEGNSCRMLARLGADMITKIKKELKSIPCSERKASDEDIDCFFDGITVVLQCFDWMAHFCY